MEKEKPLPKFLKEKHVKYFCKNLESLPHFYTSQDQNRMTIVFFCVSGLAILDSLDLIKDKKKEIIEWVYRHQIRPINKNYTGNYGFIGGPFFGGKTDQEHPQERAHIAMTYTALAVLKILGDDLSRVNKKAILESMKKLPDPTGNLTCSFEMGESDVRFVYCAAAVCHMLKDFSGINREKTVKYLLNCRRYDGGFAAFPSSESHAGPSFCIIAALHLLGVKIEKHNDLVRWLLMRQIKGFQGRPNKLEDTCYTFWIGSSLTILGAVDLMDKEKCIRFVLERQSGMLGGISKHLDSYPDILHSYLALSGLSLLGFEGLKRMSPALNIPLFALGKDEMVLDTS